MQCLQLDKAVHHVTDLPLTNYVRREFREPELMTYRHLENGNWVLGRWISRMHGVVREILIIGQSPAEFTRVQVQQLDRMMRGERQAGKIKQIARDQESAFLNAQLESQDTWNSQKARLRKRLPGLQGQHPCLRGPR